MTEHAHKGGSDAAIGSTITSRLLRVAAADLDELARLNDLLAARVAELEDERANELRATYRRGYLAGHHAKRAGRPCVTNPDRHARGDLRRILNGE